MSDTYMRFGVHPITRIYPWSPCDFSICNAENGIAFDKVNESYGTVKLRDEYYITPYDDFIHADYWYDTYPIFHLDPDTIPSGVSDVDYWTDDCKINPKEQYSEDVVCYRNEVNICKSTNKIYFFDYYSLRIDPPRIPIDENASYLEGDISGLKNLRPGQEMRFPIAFHGRYLEELEDNPNNTICVAYIDDSHVERIGSKNELRYLKEKISSDKCVFTRGVLR